MLTGNCEVKYFRNAVPSFNSGLGSIQAVPPGQLALLCEKCTIVILRFL